MRGLNHSPRHPLVDDEQVREPLAALKCAMSAERGVIEQVLLIGCALFSGARRKVHHQRGWQQELHLFRSLKDDQNKHAHAGQRRIYEWHRHGDGTEKRHVHGGNAAAGFKNVESGIRGRAREREARREGGTSSEGEGSEHQVWKTPTGAIIAPRTCSP